MAGYKINTNELIAFLYTKDKQAEKEIRATTLFTTATNKTKITWDKSNQKNERSV